MRAISTIKKTLQQRADVKKDFTDINVSSFDLIQSFEQNLPSFNRQLIYI